MKRRILASLLSLVMTLSLLPVTALAEETTPVSEEPEAVVEPVEEPAEEPETTVPAPAVQTADELAGVVPTNAATSGTCGENVKWNLDIDSGTLTISGTGAMMNWKDHNKNTENEEQYCGNPNASSDDTSCVKTDCILSRPWQSYINDITKVVVEDGITAIGTDAFNGLTNVTDVVLPDSLTTIGFGAFCRVAITEMTIPENVSKIGFSAFYECTNLSKFTFAGNKVTEIEGWTFSGCTGLKKFDIPKEITSIGRGAFNRCRGLEEFVVPESVTNLELSDFGDGSVEGTNPNTTLKKVVIKGAVSIPGFMFCRCTALETVDLGDKVTSIGVKAFWKCTSLRTVKGLNAVTEMGDYAFQECTSLDDVQFGNELKTLGKSVFGKTGLTEVTVPANVTHIGDYGFANCQNLTKIVFEHEIAPTIDNNTIANDPVLSVVALPNMSNFESLVDHSSLGSFVYWSGQTGQFTVFYVKDEEALAALQAKRTIGSPCAFAVAGENAEVPSSEKGVLAKPNRIGYNFAGWYDNAGCTGEPVTTAEANKSYYAKWVGRQLTGVTVAPKEGAKFVYGSTLNAADFVVTEVYDNGETVVVDPANYTLSLDELTRVGSVNVGITYNSKTYTCTINVEKATPEIGITADQPTLTGGGTVTLTVTGAPEKVVPTCSGVTVTENENGTFSATLPNETKTYTFTVSYAGDKNHNEAKAACTVSVTRRSSGGGSGSSSSGSSYTVSGPSTKNGDVTVSPKSAKKGDTVTITVTPDKGYELDTITVKDANGNKLKLTDKGNGKYTFTMPGSKVTVSAEFVEEQAASTFADVPADAYYAKAVEWALKNGITNGKANGLFGSNDPCTRGQIVTFLWRAAGSPAPKGTATVPADVLPGSYCYNAVAWAIENGITNGFADGTFGVNNTCTRGQSVTLLFRNAVANGLEAVTLQDLISGFGDAAELPAYAVPAMNWALSNGIVQGNGGLLLSNASCTRAQIVTFLFRAYQGK